MKVVLFLVQPVFPLASLPCEQSAIICGLEGDGFLRERLQDLGFIEFSPVTCLFSSAFGDPRAYRIKDTIIALRKKDAQNILCTYTGEQQ